VSSARPAFSAESSARFEQTPAGLARFADDHNLVRSVGALRCVATMLRLNHFGPP
jgi:hypothetical protein